jgi:tripartite-type tricarboxylate transporter receptor subunit TctC
MQKFIRCSALALCLAIGSGTVWAQAYPAKAITLIVPFAPGASADGIARIVARNLATALGKPVVVENKPGAGGATGLMALAHAAPDGYTIAMGATGAIAVNPHLPDAAPLDPQKQLTPLAKVADIPLVMIAGSKTGIKSLQDLVTQAKASPQGLSYGTAGQFTSQHLAGELFASMAKVPLVAVPYRGSSPALTDVIGGQVPMAVIDLTSAYPQVKTGRVNALAVTGETRSKIAPEIPSVAESGFPGYAATGWMGMFAPAGTSPAIIGRLSNEIQVIMAEPQVQADMMALAAEPSYLGPNDFARFISAESRKWAGILASMPRPAK